MYSTAQSQALYKRALELFPGGVNSPVRAFRSVGGTPIFMERGEGCHIYDADNNRYIDFCCSWGPLILGHCPPQVNAAIIRALEKGTSFGAPTRYENELGELIIDNNRFIEKIRFVSSGTEAVMSAIRLARGYTGKNKIIKFEGCYHGHVDHMLVKGGSGLVTFGMSSSAGVPPAFTGETIVLPLNNRHALNQALSDYDGQIAAIIIEPIPANNGLLLQDIAFLQYLREQCTQHQILLIFDEVISGFRVDFEGAAGYYQIDPDIATYGKIIGGGMPVGAYGANRDIMACIAPDGAVYQAGTLSGNPVAMAAGIAQLQTCLQPNFYKNLADSTTTFLSPIQQHIQKHQYPMRIFAIGSIFWLSFDSREQVQAADEIDSSKMSYFKHLHHLLLQRGVYFGPSGYEVGFVSAAHQPDDLAYAAQAILESLDTVFAES